MLHSPQVKLALPGFVSPVQLQHAHAHRFGNMPKGSITCQAIGRRFDQDALSVASWEVDGAKSDTKWPGCQKGTSRHSPPVDSVVAFAGH